MKWHTTLVLGGLAIVLLAFQTPAQAGNPTAVDYLKQGAKLIDVRTSQEFQAGHLAKAINIPLDQLEQKISQEAPDKEQAILLHCASGVRSGKAAKILKKLGYSKVLDLGSYSRAEAVVRESQK
jgi:phage shock protein E